MGYGLCVSVWLFVSLAVAALIARFILRCRRPQTALGMAVLLLATAQYIPEPPRARRPQSNTPDVSSVCCSCCGSSCACTGDCCADSHVSSGEDGRAPAGTETPTFSAPTELKRQKRCGGGWIVFTASSNHYPSIEPAGRARVASSQSERLRPFDAIGRWSRPAVSQSNPRAPPAIS